MEGLYTGSWITLRRGYRTSMSASAVSIAEWDPEFYYQAASRNPCGDFYQKLGPESRTSVVPQQKRAMRKTSKESQVQNAMASD
ncbi:hypothetical protein RvY_02080 [Ramazzottius varieornatus]|uniref:Uncharacterized protein n=1 Tax=Ramazzottius varieornatus TaxID=947166 RepID=A0A1D1UTN5_RAMVA|nr:hypothetical protein RvY_02080 [Ramazzottius varieornatus]